MFCFAGYGYVNGEVRTLLAPVDARGDLCGFTKGVKEYPKLWIANFKGAAGNPTKMFTYGACVEKCPTGKNQPVKCAPNNSVPNCGKASSSYATIDTMNYCIPKLDELSDEQKAGYEGLIKNFSSGFFGSYAADIYKARWVIVASVGICFVLTLIYITLMRCCADILAWVSIIFI